MKTIDIKVPLLEDVFLAVRSAGFSKGRMTLEIRRAFALYLFKKGILSFGKAASLAEMSKSDFMDLLDQEGISLHYSVEALERDINTAYTRSNEEEKALAL